MPAPPPMLMRKTSHSFALPTLQRAPRPQCQGHFEFNWCLPSPMFVFICFDIKAVIIWSIAVEHLLCLCMSHLQGSSWLASAHALVACIVHSLSSAMVKGWRHVDDTERRLVRNMVKERIPWVTIHRITGCSSATIRSMLNPARTTVKKGAPIKFRAKDVDKVLKVAEKMLKHADGQKENSLEMIQRAAGIKLSPTTVRKALKERGIGFFKLKEKPLLEDEDINFAVFCQRFCVMNRVLAIIYDKHPPPR